MRLANKADKTGSFDFASFRLNPSLPRSGARRISIPLARFREGEAPSEPRSIKMRLERSLALRDRRPHGLVKAI